MAESDINTSTCTIKHIFTNIQTNTHKVRVYPFSVAGGDIQVGFPLRTRVHLVTFRLRYGYGVLTNKCSRIPQEMFVWVYDSFDNNFEIMSNFTKYLEEMC